MKRQHEVTLHTLGDKKSWLISTKLSHGDRPSAEEVDHELSNYFADKMAGKLCKENVDTIMDMKIACPTANCKGKLKLKIHAMLVVIRNENGQFDEIDEAQWEIL